MSAVASAAMYEISLTHSIDTGHRIVGHKGKCARLHGHTYKITVELSAAVLVEPGFVQDFGDIKDVLNEWDHRTLIWEDDPFATGDAGWYDDLGVVLVPFNPTAENMARHLAEQFAEGCAVARVTVRETVKSSSQWTAFGK